MFNTKYLKSIKNIINMYIYTRQGEHEAHINITNHNMQLPIRIF